MTTLHDRVVLITGASSGIGAASARAFARHGARLALTARRADRLAALARDLSTEALILPADLAQPGDVERLVEATLARFGRVDVLVNNAGAARLGWLEQLTADEVAGQVQLNLLSVIELTRRVLPGMLARGSGHVITMASLAGHIASPTYTVYAATKFAVRGFSEALRREVEPFGVRVSVISPGGVAATEFAERAGLHRRTGLTTPRWLRPRADDVARAVVGVVQHPRREVIVPWPLHAAVWLNALLPGLVDWLVMQVFTRRERRAE